MTRSRDCGGSASPSAVDRFFVPSYVGHRGWLGVRLDVPVDWGEIAGLVRDAYLGIAPPSLAARIDARLHG